MAPLEKTSRIRSRRNEKVDFRKQIARGLFRLVLISLALGAFSYVTHRPFFALEAVMVEGGVTISHDEIREIAKNELRGTYFRIVPKNFAYLYPHDRMIAVLEKNTRMYNIEISRFSRNELAITFDEHIPHALLCAQNDGEKCFYMTEEGYAFDTSPQLQGGSLTRYILEDTTRVVRGQIFGRDEIVAIENFIEQVSLEIGFRISSLLYKKNGDIEFQVNGGGMIFVTSGKDFTKAFENLKAILASQEFSHIKPGNFQYIDVRFENKAFVNETVQLATTTAPTTLEEVVLSE